MTAQRGLAKKAAKGAETPAPQKAADFNPNVVTGLNVFKDGSQVLPGFLADGKDPEVRPDSEYPDWVLTLHEPLPSLEDLKEMYVQDPEGMSEDNTRRMIKLWNKARIKESNESKAKQ